MDLPLDPPQSYRFGSFELAPSERTLTQHGIPVALGPRLFDLLVALAQRPGQLVSKAELMRLAWPHVVVEENNLHVQISKLRKLLGPEAIATVTAHGYRFTPRVETRPASAPGRPGLADAPSREDPLPRLIGRDKDLADLEALLRDARVVTLVGAGGVGKTRLAKAAADRLRPAYAHGSVVVDLGPLNHGAAVLTTFARMLRLPVNFDGLNADIVGQAASALSMLVVVDNCEHLIDAVSGLVEALCRLASFITVIVTSQQSLRIEIERAFLLRPLATPRLRSPTTARMALSYGAVELFCDRARAVVPGFELDDRNCDSVVDVCCRLDGIALAIELAVARLPLLGIEGLRERLSDRLQLLTQGFRNAPHKHKTLRNALEWSHDLLTATEQAVFRRLGVLAGSFSMETAQQVASFGDVTAQAALDSVGVLVDKSILVARFDGAASYRMLETMRLYALERLAAAGEVAHARRRQAGATLASLETFDRNAWRIAASASNSSYDDELVDLRAALAWTQGPDGDKPMGVALATASRWVWESLGLGFEGVRHMLSLREHVADPMPPARQAAYWRGLCFHFIAGCWDIPDLQRVALRAIESTRAVDDPRALYEALLLSVFVSARCARLAAARRDLEEAIALEDAGWPARLRALRCFAQAEWLEGEDRLQDAMAAQRQRLELLRVAGASGVELHAQSQLVVLDVASGNLEGAICRGQSALRSLAPRCLPFRARALYVALSSAFLQAGDIEAAVTLLRTATPLLRGSIAQWHALDLLALLWIRIGDPHRSVQILACADRIYRRQGFVRKPHAIRFRGRLLELMETEFRARLLVFEWPLSPAEMLSESEVLRFALDI